MKRPKFQYMVDFTLPDDLTDEFVGLIPFQRAAVNKLFTKGKLASYSLSLENAKLWAVFNAYSEIDVMDMISDLPLSSFMKVKIHLLTFHNAVNQVSLPEFSLN